MVSNVPSVGVSQVANIRPAFRGEPCQQVCEDGSCPVACAPEEKHGSVLGFIFKTLIAAGLVAGGLVLARRNVEALKGELSALEKDTTFFGKVKYYTAKAGQAIEDFAKSSWEKVKGLFGDKKTPTDETPPADPPKAEDKKE